MNEFIGGLRTQARQSDKISFHKYKYKQISLSELKNEIIDHNEIPDEVAESITDDDFKKWVRSLGWIV